MSQVAQIAFRKSAVRTAVPSTDKSSSLHPKKGGPFLESHLQHTAKMPNFAEQQSQYFQLSQGVW